VRKITHVPWGGLANTIQAGRVRSGEAKMKLTGEARVSIRAAPSIVVEDNACILGGFGKEGTRETKKLTIIPRGYSC